jgi:hypothetical protein
MTTAPSFIAASTDSHNSRWYAEHEDDPIATPHAEPAQPVGGGGLLGQGEGVEIPAAR